MRRDCSDHGGREKEVVRDYVSGREEGEECQEGREREGK